MKGLMTLLCHAGPNATWFCIFCFAKINETNLAGVPHLPVLPEEWASIDKRPPDIINPPPRESTMDMDRSATSYANAKKAVAPKPLSSAGFASCAEKPLVFSQKILVNFAGTVLHITLGLGTNHMKLHENECLGYDE